VRKEGCINLYKWLEQLHFHKVESMPVIRSSRECVFVMCMNIGSVLNRLFSRQYRVVQVDNLGIILQISSRICTMYECTMKYI
jgi:hypothetical protein